MQREINANKVQEANKNINIICHVFFGKSNVLTTYPYQDCVYIGLVS